MNRITINGKVIEVEGHNISIIGDSIIVRDSKMLSDGVTIEKGLSGVVDVKFEGDLANLTVHRGNAEINGNIRGNVDAGGSVKCSGDVGGDIEAGGSVTCENVEGSVDAGGSVTCNNITGDIDAGGSVKMRR